MAEVLEMEDVRLLEQGVCRTPVPDENHLLLYMEGSGLPVKVAVYQAQEERSLPPATPDHLLLGNLNHPGLCLRQPLQLTITREDALVVASVPELEEFGYGPHLTAAVEDFRQALIELYQTLKAEQERLGPDLGQLWQRLKDLIEER